MNINLPKIKGEPDFKDYLHNFFLSNGNENGWEEPYLWVFATSGQPPSVIDFKTNAGNITEIRKALLTVYTDQIKYSSFIEENGKNKIHGFFLRKNFYYLDDHVEAIKIIYFDDELNKSILDVIKKYLLENYKPSTESKIYLMVNNALQSFAVKPFNINLELNYNDDLIPVHNRITDTLNCKNEKGLLLIHGQPGTGKTTYIRYLTRIINKKIIFLQHQFAMNLASTDFITFMMKEKNSVLVIEDAENLLIDRKQQRSFSVSSLLNLADGLLSDCLNIDPELMRKGRLIACYEFKALEQFKAKKLAESIGSDMKITGPTKLCDIYNSTELSWDYASKRKIGF